MRPDTGIIEGFFGKPWSWDERRQVVNCLSSRGLGFYIYAPKSDPYLRRRWSERHSDEEIRELSELSNFCASRGVRFGIGLTPFEVSEFNHEVKLQIKEKIKYFDEIGVSDLCILFDDMRGENPNIMDIQCNIVHYASEASAARKVIMCPTYYSDDAILDKVFGKRPDLYLEHIGSNLDPSIEIFWTGQEVCSKAISEGDVIRIAEKLKRRVAIWDNYPVNDGPRMSERLHLRPFTGRSHAIADHVSRHAVNPAMQPVLSCVPYLTLMELYEAGGNYAYMDAWQRAALEIWGKPMTDFVLEHWLTFSEEKRLDILKKIPSIFNQLSGIRCPAGDEIYKWLKGEYIVTSEMVMTQ